MNKKFLAFPFLIYLVVISIIVKYDQFAFVINEWKIALTMLLGSIVAGSTAEGGAAVAFPIMTLVLGIAPHIARDFGIAIQSIGMTSASGYILGGNIKIVRSVLFPIILGSLIGTFLGFHYFSHLLSPAEIKFLFTGLWQSFAFALWLSHKKGHRLTEDILVMNLRRILSFLVVGFIGGAITSMVGSGIDLLTFSILTLYFNINVKVATPTSVVIMAINSMMAVMMKFLFFEGLHASIYPMLLASSLIVVFGAPLGAYIVKKVSSDIVKIFLYTSITLQSIWAWIILPKTSSHAFIYFGFLLLGAIFFYLISHSCYKKKWGSGLRSRVK